MSDDLVMRLRDCPDMDAVDEAADALETQATRIAELEARADRNAAGYARVDAKARRAEFLHKQKIAAMQKRVRKLEYLVQCLLDEDPNNLAADGGVTVLDVWRKEARAALAGGKDG